MATPMWIRQTLVRRGIPFREIHHVLTYTAQDLAQVEHFSGHHVAKVVVVMADDQLVELILPASRRIDFARVRLVLGVRQVRLATEDEMAAHFADCEVGALPALRHWSGAPVLMDPSLNVQGDILFQAGTYEDAVQLDFQQWYDLVQPQVATFVKPAEAVYA